VRRRFSFLIALVLFVVPSVFAQNKLLTIDDIFDPQKRVNFSGTPAVPRWLKDGGHYIVTSKERNAFPRLLKVNAVTGKSEPLYDAAKMQAAFAALPGFSKDDARRLANQSSYQMNPQETAVLINSANDLFYYEFGSDRAIRLTANPDEEVGEGFSPDGKMVSFIRGGNLYVEDLSMQRRERALTRDGDDKILNGRLSQYRLPRFSDLPVIETVLLDRKDIPSVGAGECPMIGLAPAIANAIFDATGTRLRALPLAPNGLKSD